MTETKSDKFIRLAETRTNEAIKRIRLLRNLSNKNNYDYSEEQANEIIQALEKELKGLKQVYRNESLKNNSEFKFKQDRGSSNMMNWNFPSGKRLSPTGINNGDIEMFLDNIGDSLTREVIQNSLDASNDELNKPVRVEFSIFKLKTQNICKKLMKWAKIYNI